MDSEVTTLETILAVVAQEACVPVESITAETTLGSLGLDSLEVAQLAIALEDALEVELTEFDRSTKLGALIECLMESAKP